MSLLDFLFRRNRPAAEGGQCKAEAPEKEPESSTPEQATLGNKAIVDQAQLAAKSEEIRSNLGSNDKAKASLDAFAGNADVKAADPAQQKAWLERFAEAPNDATASYLSGEAMLARSPDKQKEALALQNPTSGKFAKDGKEYNISNGSLLDAKGKTAGSIDNLGAYKLGDAEGSVYSDLDTRAKLVSGTGKDAKTLLDLHPADAPDRMNEKIFPGLVERVEDTYEQLRREGVSMGTASGYRSPEEQNRLYRQGRTAPGNVVTNVKGGDSWHNHGAAMDSAFHTANGGLTWQGNWDRYGEVAESKGLEWGGAWKSFPDRPHVEFHPGFDAGQAYQLKDEHNKGGLTEVWKEFEGAGLPDELSLDSEHQRRLA